MVSRCPLISLSGCRHIWSDHGPRSCEETPLQRQETFSAPCQSRGRRAERVDEILAARDAAEPLQYEVDDPCPPHVAIAVGLQGAALVLAPTVLIVAISIRSSGLDDTYLTWGVFAALLINAAITALQAFQVWRFGGGHIVITGPTTVFIGITVAAVSAAGPSTLASLLVVCCVIQVALAWWLPTLRRIVTPVVSGTVMILIAVTVLPIAFDHIQTLPAGTSTGAGPAVAGVTLLVSVIMTLRATGTLATGCSLYQHCGGMRGGRWFWSD